MKRNLKENDSELAAYFLQQSLEKYLKAFLLQHGWKLKKIPTLPTLLDDAIKYKPVLESFRELCEHITDYYFTGRYPQIINSELTIKNIEKDIKEAKKFINTMFPKSVK